MENSFTKWQELQEELELRTRRDLPIVQLSSALYHSVMEWRQLEETETVLRLMPLAEHIMDLCRAIIANDVIHFNNYFYYSLPKIFRFCLSLEYDYFIYRD